MIAAKRKNIHTTVTAALTGLVEALPIQVLQVGYGATKEGLKARLINLVGEVITNIIQQRKMHLRLMRSNEALTLSGRFLKAYT